ncbi:MAG: (Fe-S)-binding protein, partial [Stellaceae bacterium]
VLEDAGFEVVVPRQRLCCGRPLYDYGMLDLAKRKLRQVLDALRPAIRAGVPVVGIEPSCLSVFRDELLNLMPEDEDAQRLAKQTKLLSEFLLAQEAWRPPHVPIRALLHEHCHHRAVLDSESDAELLKRMGVELLPNAAGCCGQAGAFGYEAEHAEVAVKIAQQAFLPAVRKAGSDAAILADGFSCREQVRLGTGRRALHPAELIAAALDGDAGRSAPSLEALAREAPAAPRKESLAALAMAGAVLAALVLKRAGGAKAQDKRLARAGG